MKRNIAILLMLANVAVAGLAAQGRDEKTVIYEVKWHESAQMRSLIAPFIDGRVAAAPFNTLTVTATEREHVVVEELLAKYDVQPRSFQLQCFLLKASAGSEGIKDGVPDFVRDVVRDVASLTRFTHFELIDAPILRVSDRRSASITGETPIQYTISIGRSQIVEEEGKHHLRMPRFSIHFKVLTGYRVGDMVADAKALEKELEKANPKPLVEPIYRSGGIDTAFNIADGETIVLGASRMASVSSSDQTVDFAIVTVVTAKLLP